MNVFIGLLEFDFCPKSSGTKGGQNGQNWEKL